MLKFSFLGLNFMDKQILSFYLGHLTLMVGLYFLSHEIQNKNISSYLKWLAINSLIIGGMGILILSYKHF